MGHSDGFQVTLDLSGDGEDTAAFTQSVLDAMPYTAHMGVEVRTVEPGHAQIALPADDRFTNHIGTVHAIAELVPAETCGGVAITSELTDLLARGYVPIAKELRVEWTAPARGQLLASARLDPDEAERMRAAAAAGERVACDLDITVEDVDATVVAQVVISYVLKQLGAGSS